MKRVIAILLSAFMAAALCSCSPTNTETMSNAQKALEEGDFENAAALYQAAIDEGKQLQACYRGKGIALMGRMEYENAAEAFNKALESATFIEEKIYRDGMEDDIRRYLASCYIHNGEPQQAILVYNALIEKNDSVISLYTERGTAKAAAGDLEGAKADFDKAINMDRGNYALILNIAQTLEQYGGRSIGEGYLAGAGSVEGLDPVLRGRILYFMKDYQGALDLLGQYAEADESAAMIVCRSYLALGDTEAAKGVIDSFGDKVENSVELLDLLGSIFMKQGKYAEAAEVYERAVNAAKESGDLQVTLYNRIVAYEYAGNFEKARELLTNYLQQYSGDEDAKRELRFLKTR